MTRQGEVPMFEKCIRIMPKIERKQLIMECQIKAINTFIEKCKVAADELTMDLVSCRNISLNSELLDEE